MRWVNGFSCAVMGLFAVVQYNDPDALLWILIYAIAALWAGMAAWRPGLLSSGPLVLAAYGLCLAAVIAGTIYLWPGEIATWWDNEEVREGFGLLITTTVLLIVGLTVVRERRQTSHAA